MIARRVPRALAVLALLLGLPAGCRCAREHPAAASALRLGAPGPDLPGQFERDRDRVRLILFPSPT